MNHKYTSGPWRVETDLTIHAAPDIGNDATIVAYCGVHPAERTYEAQQANARLIAALPDLLKALQNIANQKRTGDIMQQAIRMQRIARIAIAKAIQP